MKSRKVQKIPGRSGKKGIEAEKCRKYPRRSGKKGMEAEKDRKYPRRSGKKGIEAEKCRKYPGAAAGRVWRPKRIGNTRAQLRQGDGIPKISIVPRQRKRI